MKIEEDGTVSAYRIAQRRAIVRQIWRAYILYGIPLSIAASWFAYSIDAGSVRLILGALLAPLATVVGIVYIPLMFEADRHVWEITDSEVHFRRPRNISTKVSKILRTESRASEDLPGYYFLSLDTRFGGRLSIIVEERTYPADQLLELLKNEPNK